MANPMEKLRAHLDDAGLLAGYTVRFYNWTDEDLNGAGQVVCLRRSGTGGAGDYILDSPDVSILIICDPAQIKAGETRLDQIRDYLFSDHSSADTVLFFPVGNITGPSILSNGRARFEMVVRLTIDRTA